MHAKRRTWVTIAVIGIAGIIVILLALWGLCILCDFFGHPPNDTSAMPDYTYSYNMVNNGTISNVIIRSQFTFYLYNDVRFLETTRNDIEVKLWGKYLISTVEFNKNDTTLTVDIDVKSYSSNDFGAQHANEYIYLPKNWTYTIVSNNKNGNTIVENKTWNYTAAP